MPLKKCSKFKSTIIIITALLLFLEGALFYRLALKIIYPIKYEEFVEEASLKYGIERVFIYAVIKVESGFDKDAVSSKKANGLMQITTPTAEYIAKLKGVKNYDLFDAKTNIDFGVFYMRYLFDRFGDIKTTFIAYNAGEGRVREWLNDKTYSVDGVILKSIPYEETKEYLVKIEKAIKNYKKLYPYLLDK